MNLRVLLVPNLANPDAVSAACELASWLSGEGLEPVLASEDAAGCGLADFGVSANEIGEPGLVVSLGGDGTILKSVHLIGYVEAPIIGINLGRLGFMTGAGAGSMRAAVSSALAGEGRIERRATLEAAVHMKGREVGRYRALNEVYVGRTGSTRVVEVGLGINGDQLTTLACDGIIVATATGSTAYALSAGGPIVAPDVGCSVVVPVAAHTLESRPLVVGPSDVVELTLPNPDRAGACVAIDGDSAPCRQNLELVEVRRCESDVLLVKLDGRDFYEVVSTEFLGG